MRLLFIHDGGPEALALEGQLADHAQLRVFNTLDQAINDLSLGAGGVDLVILDLPVAATADILLLGCLRELVNPAPILLGVGQAAALIASFGNQKPVSVAQRGERSADLAQSVEALIDQQRALGQAIAAQRIQLAAELDRAAARAAEAAVHKAADQFAAKLPIDDVDGLKLAIRFARGWEEARVKFMSALTTGVASAFLLALGAGIIAVVKGSTAK